MEKTARAAVVPLTADWSDLGSWEAFYEAAPHDGDGNVRVGDVYAEGAENCYLHASNRMVARSAYRIWWSWRRRTACWWRIAHARRT